VEACGSERLGSCDASQVLRIIASLLLAHKCRQALLRSGSMYAVLDLLGQRKRGAGFFTHAELATLNMLKVSRG